MFDSITKLSMPQCITSAINSFTSLWLCRKVSTSLGNLYHLAKNVISRLVGDKLTFPELTAGRSKFDGPLRDPITNPNPNPMPIVSISQSLTNGSNVADVANVAGVIVASAPKPKFHLWVSELKNKVKEELKAQENADIHEKLQFPPLRHDQLKTDLKGLVSEIANRINVPIKGEQREKLIKQVTNSFFARPIQP